MEQKLSAELKELREKQIRELQQSKDHLSDIYEKQIRFLND